MARKLNRLSVKRVAAISEQGYYADGGGLYLQVSKWRTKSWIFRYMRAGKSTDMGLGAAHTVTLAEARDKALACRKLVLDGIDPRQAREERRAQHAAAIASAISFKRCAEEHIARNRSAWANEKHAQQWANTLATYAYPVMGETAVRDVDTALILKALTPIWNDKHETATRVRARIERVLDDAKALGYRDGDNPARWKGHLDKLLTKVEKRRRVKHHAALSFHELGQFLQDLGAEEGTGARALAHTILTVARTNETLGARAGEFDLDAEIWTVPAARMKAKREHRVPLSPAVIAGLRAAGIEAMAPDEVVFAARSGEPLSNMAMLKVLERMGRDDITVHGFRSTFRDWAAECTSYPREVCEMALAHVVDDQTEAAYRRGDLFEKRRHLMNDWAKYCSVPAVKAEIVALRKTG